MTAVARIEGFLLPQWIAAQGTLARLRAMRRVGRLIADGTLASEVGTIYPMGDFAAALRASVASARGGKVLLGFA